MADGRVKRQPRRVGEQRLPSLRPSQSFSEQEVEWMRQLLNQLFRGGDVSVLMQRRELLIGWLGKVNAMRRSIEKMKKKRKEMER